MDVISLALINKLKAQLNTVESAHLQNVTLSGRTLKFVLDSGDEFTVTLPTTDLTLTKSGEAADAKVVGECFAANEAILADKADISTLEAQVNALNASIAAKADNSTIVAQISSLQSTLTSVSAQLRYDAAPTPNSTKLVQSGGIYSWGTEMLDPLDAIIGNAGSTVSVSAGTVVVQPPKGFKTQVVTQLPTTGEESTFYLKAQTNGASGNVYDEYIWTGTNFEKLGSTNFVYNGVEVGSTATDAKTVLLINNSATQTFNVPEIKDEVTNTTDTWSSSKIAAKFNSLTIKDSITNKNYKLIIENGQFGIEEVEA